MYKYVIKRVLMMIPVLLGVVFVVFFIMSLSPVNPAEVILGDGATPESILAKEEELGLNKPLIVRYFNYIYDLLHGDMGFSWKNHMSVSGLIKERFLNTLALALTSEIVALLIGIPMGIISAKNQN